MCLSWTFDVLTFAALFLYEPCSKKKIHHETSSSHKYSGKENQAQWWWSSGFICWKAAWSPSGVKRNTQTLLAEKYARFSPSCLSRPVPAINCLFGICVQECSDYYPLACFLSELYLLFVQNLPDSSVRSGVMRTFGPPNRVRES